MIKLLPKKVLDKELLKELTKYYRINTSDPDWDPEKFIEWECFSHPSLQYHDCNYRAKLLGNNACDYCNHVPERPCKISCDLQHFCLSVFAWRMGIGGEDFTEALNHNLYELKREELYNEVIKVFSLEAVEYEESVEDEDPEESYVIEDSDSDAENGYLTIKEASDYYGCTYAHIYNNVVGGKLPFTEDSNGKKRVSKTDLDEFKSNRTRV